MQQLDTWVIQRLGAAVFVTTGRQTMAEKKKQTISKHSI